MDEARRERVTVMIPCYNEEAGIGPTIDAIRAAMDGTDREYEILVVDDCSSDRSAEVAREHGARVIRHFENKGEGRARKTGTLHARGELVVTIDADCTYPADRIPEILSCMDQADMVVGDRSTEAGTHRLLRRPAKWIIRKLAGYITGRTICDLNSGLRCYRKATATQFMRILPDTHSMVSTLTIAYLASGLTVRYVPIDYYPRVGKSTFHPVRDTANYLLLVFRTVMYFSPLKILAPLAVLLVLGGAGRFLYAAVAHQKVPVSAAILSMGGFVVAAIGLLADMIVKMNRPTFDH